MVIKRVRPFSCARVAAALYAAVGLILGAGFSLMSLAGGFSSFAFAANPVRPVVPFPFAMGPLAILVFPICYGALGFVSALVGSWLYNLTAGVVGGIQVELE
jgi:hypothetical protein